MVVCLRIWMFAFQLVELFGRGLEVWPDWRRCVIGGGHWGTKVHMGAHSVCLVLVGQRQASTTAPAAHLSVSVLSAMKFVDSSSDTISKPTINSLLYELAWSKCFITAIEKYLGQDFNYHCSRLAPAFKTKNTYMRKRIVCVYIAPQNVSIFISFTTVKLPFWIERGYCISTVLDPNYLFS